MKRERVGVDFDDVMSPTYKVLCDKYNIPIFVEQYTAGIKEFEPEQAEEMIGWLTGAINETLPKTEPIDGAVEAIGELAIKRDLIVVTGKPIGTQEVTDVWIHKHFGGLFKHTLYTDRFNPENRPKAEVCDRLNIKTLVDDYPGQNIPAGTTHLLFGGYREWQPYILAENEIPVRDWQEVLDYHNGTGRFALQGAGVQLSHSDS